MEHANHRAEKARAKLNADIDTFLNSGGEIKQLLNGDSAFNRARAKKLTGKARAKKIKVSQQRSVLTVHQVKMIRILFEKQETPMARVALMQRIAVDLNVCYKTVRDAAHRITWKEVA